jgi:hypothetical protein
VLWLFSQMFLLCLASFAVGSVLTWSLVRGRAQAESPRQVLALPAPRPSAEQNGMVVSAAVPESLPLKGNSKTMVYHTADSPYYRRMKGDRAFGSEAEAIAAGFRMWTTKARVKA